jgi:Interferon-induced 6-16 family
MHIQIKYSGDKLYLKSSSPRCDSPPCFRFIFFWRFFSLSLVSVSYPIRYDQSKSHDRSPLIKVKEKNCLASSLLTVAVSLLPSLSSAVHCCAGLVLRRKFSRFQLEARGGVVGTKPVVSTPLEARYTIPVESSMGSSRADAIPFVSQCKSVAQLWRGDVWGALQTQNTFTKQCIVVSQLRSATEALCGNSAAARRTQQQFCSVHNLTTQGSIVGSALLMPVAATAAITQAGFTATVIAANSAGAALMSSYGGAVTAGSLFAVLQSVGAAGLSSVSTAALSVAGVTAAAALRLRSKL